jgi:hypothetical protein
MKFRPVMIAVVVAALASAAQGQCVGDCDGNGEVTVDELIVGVDIVLGTAALDDCPSFDADGNGEVTVDELIVGVNNALQGCGPTPTPTLTPEPPTPTPTLTPEPPTPTPSPTATTMTTLSSVDVVIGQGTGICGASRDGDGVKLKDVNCGFTYVGGGGSTAPPVLAPQLRGRFAVAGCTGSRCTLAATSGPQAAPLDCTDVDCPLGQPQAVSDPLPTCTLVRWSAPGDGSVDLSDGTLSVTLHSMAHTWLTTSRTAPCPLCVQGQCERGARAGLACTSTDPGGLSFDCPPGGGDGSADIGFIPVDAPFSTDSQSVTTPDGVFCAGQDAIRPGLAGCFASRVCRTIDAFGVPAAGGFLPPGSSHAVTLASIACVPATGSALIDSTSDIPGPSAVGAPFTITVNP